MSLVVFLASLRMASMREMDRVNEIFNCFGKNDVLFMFKFIPSHLLGYLAFSLYKTIMKGLTGNIIDYYFKANK